MPDPPRAPGDRASINSASAASHSASVPSGSTPSDERTTAQTSTPVAARTRSTRCGFASPWSCTTCSPTSSTISAIDCSPWSANTPTFRARRPARVSRASSGDRSRGPPAKITPRYSTPAASAYSASTARVSPQILMSDGTRPPRHRRDRAGGFDRVESSGDARADQHRIRPTSRIAHDVVARPHSALRDCHDVAWDLRDEPLGGGGIDEERLEVTVIDPDHPGAAFECALELSFVADLDEDLEREGAGRVDHLAESVRRERPDDEQRGGRAQSFRLDELDGTDVKVLLERGHLHGAANGEQVVRAAGEVRRLGQHADRGRSALDVRARL